MSNFLPVYQTTDELHIEPVTQGSATGQTATEITQPYVGLANIGATCYMNSVLQSLFMTYDFRSELFKWRLNTEQDEKEEDCIPYQLQFLFAKLQTRFHTFVDTRQLIKSFQWDAHQAFEQHDCQEFVRILLEAIEKAFQGTVQENFINNIFQGTLVNFVQCLECHNESLRQENFMDINITVKSVFDQVYNDSLEKGLQRYLKTELLSEDNKYFCEKCQKKVDAKRGSRLCKLPKILTLILNRFTFDVFTMQRVKLDDYVSFPFVLNMNDYINGYEGIPNKLPEDNGVDAQQLDTKVVIKPDFAAKRRREQQAATEAKRSGTQTKGTTIRTKAQQQNTREFIKNKRKQLNFQGTVPDSTPTMLKNPNEDLGMYTVEPNEDPNMPPLLVKISAEKNSLQNATKPSQESAVSPQPTSANVEQCEVLVKQQSQQEEEDHQSNLAIKSQQSESISSNRASLQSTPQSLSAESHFAMTPAALLAAEQQQQQQQPHAFLDTSENQNGIPSASQKNNGVTSASEKQTNVTPEELAARRAKEKEEQQARIRENLAKYQSDREAAVQKYLKQGDCVYELYSILVHSGGAYGGHYFAYIKSFEDGKWYDFNDTRISELDVAEIVAHSFGGQSRNAYMLLYRVVDPSEQEVIQSKDSTATPTKQSNQKKVIKDDDIPQSVRDALHQHKEAFLLEQRQREEALQLLQVRIHWLLAVKTLQVRANMTLEALLDLAVRQYDIREKRENIRLRAYKPKTDSMLETYERREHLTLAQLQVAPFKNFCIEVKKDGEVFEEFDASSIHVRLCRWHPGIASLDEQYLTTEKFKASKNASFLEFLQELAQYLHVPNDCLAVLQKHQVHGFACAENLVSDANLTRTLEEVEIFENSLLYVEEIVPGTQLKWVEEFETDLHRVAIKFNSPQRATNTQENAPVSVLDQEFPYSIGIFSSSSFYQEINPVIDSRLTVSDLKEKICKQLELHPQEIILRRGGRAGVEVKEGKKQSIKSLHFMNGSSLYLEYGRPAAEGEFRILFSFARAVQNSDTQFHEFEELGEFPLSGALKVSEAREVAARIVRESLNIELEPKLLRLRERVSNRVSKIYRERPLRDQNLIDRRMIAIEALDFEENLGAREQQIYVRLWDQEKWTLSERLEITVQKSDSPLDLAIKIREKDSSIEISNMHACRITAVWNFNKYDLLNEEWHRLNMPDNLLGSQPFHIQNDGLLLMQDLYSHF